MKGILILAHGSREKQTENTLHQIIDLLQKKTVNTIIGKAFLQFSEINLEKGLDLLVKKGASEIVIIPYFLFDGIHIREDIPKEIEEYKKGNPDIKVSLGKTLGVDERLVDILLDRVGENA